MERNLSRLLSELGEAFEKSDIKKYCDANGHNWHYSLVTSTLETDRPLIIGFNWGAEKGYKYKPQNKIESSNFLNEKVGSLSRIYPYCREHFGKDFLSKTSQTNYCFFRSETESQISMKDIELCEPIFEKLITIIRPSLILSFSSKLRNYLIKNRKIEVKASKLIKFKKGKSEVAYEALRATTRSGIEIKFLPHPNYPMKREARAAAWKFCCAGS